MNDHKSANHLTVYLLVCVCVSYIIFTGVCVCVYMYIYYIYCYIIYIYMRHILDSTGGRKDLS